MRSFAEVMIRGACGVSVLMSVSGLKSCVNPELLQVSGNQWFVSTQVDMGRHQSGPEAINQCLTFWNPYVFLRDVERTSGIR